ncbi:MAG: response regulator transcription factor [Eubacteriales bacterium]
MQKIYIAEDDPHISNILKTHLEQTGYEVDCFSDGRGLLSRFSESPCDLIITDIMMPNLNGYELCKEIRQKSMVPLVMISANNDEVDRLLGLELGGDDYIGKPVNLRELTIKVRNSLLRMDLLGNKPSASLQYQDLTLDLERRSAKIGEENFELTTKEFDLLKMLLGQVGKPFSREAIIREVWQYDFDGDTRQVDQLMKRLRKKMLVLGAICEIKTVWGFGYKIGDEDEK